MSDFLAEDDHLLALPPEGVWLSCTAAAAAVDCSERTIYRRISTGQFTTRRSAGRTLVNLSQVLADLEPKEN